MFTVYQYCSPAVKETEEENEVTIFEHAESVFKMQYKEAIEILNYNLVNITNHAKNERNEK